MWNQLSNWLYRVFSGWVTISALLIFIVFTALVLPGQSSGDAAQRGDTDSPDLSIYYSANDLYRMAEGYGELGRANYIQARFTFDLIWPLVYTFFLVTCLSWIYGRALTAESKWRKINLLPVLGMVGDYLENISTSAVMWRYPLPTPIIDWMAGVFTALKWLFIGCSFAGLLIGGAILIWKTISQDKAGVQIK